MVAERTCSDSIVCDVLCFLAQRGAVAGDTSDDASDNYTVIGRSHTVSEILFRWMNYATVSRSCAVIAAMYV